MKCADCKGHGADPMSDNVNWLRCGSCGGSGVARPARPQRHTCHWPGCGREVPPAMWGCRAHWFRLPKRLRDNIWRAYRPGQEITKTPSREYLAAAREVDDWIRANAI